MVYTGQIFYRDRCFNGLKESGRLVEPDAQGHSYHPPPRGPVKRNQAVLEAEATET